MFLKSFADLRAKQDTAADHGTGKQGFDGLLSSTTIEAIVHLGRYAFSEIGNALVAPVMFVSKALVPYERHRIWACSLVAPRPSEEQARLLQQASQGRIMPTDTDSGPRLRPVELDGPEIFAPVQLMMLGIEGAPLVYRVSEQFLRIVMASDRLSDLADVRPGPQTSDNTRFTRTIHEIPLGALHKRWFLLSKGGGYQKWCGLNNLCLEWEHDGGRVKEFNQRNGDHWSRNVRNVDRVFRTGYAYSSIGRAFAVRRLSDLEICDTKGPGIYPRDKHKLIGIVLNTRFTNYFLKSVNAALDFNPHAVASIPLPGTEPRWVSSVFDAMLHIKEMLVSLDPNEYSFRSPAPSPQTGLDSLGLAAQAELATLESFCESEVLRLFGVSEADSAHILADAGTPPGFHPLLWGYDAWLPQTSAPELPPIPEEVTVDLASASRIAASDRASAVKSQLRRLIEGDLVVGDRSQTGSDDQNNGEDAIAGPTAAHAVPAETMVERLSLKLQVHPVSVYWLLKELQTEGVHYKPEEKRLQEDRLTVLVLRLLGHRWPRQIEAGEPVPDWADTHGIMTVTSGTGEPTAAERLRERLRAEEGDLGAQRTEAVLQELTGLTLEEWVRRQFFTRHVRQFKYRPIAWHLASAPQGGNGKRAGARRQPAFECLVYYHACAGDVLARLRSQYLLPLILVEQRRAEDARRAGDETGAALAAERIIELEAFAAKLRQVDEEGFACSELDKLVATEPLDRWSGDGHQAPSDRGELLRRERTWHVDTNDGVRVNIAPLLLAGVLAADVLKTADARKAIADRARWRADERRWVREGKLPRCGWMGDDVPESPRWRELAPQREAERRKLEEKRRSASERLL